MEISGNKTVYVLLPFNRKKIHVPFRCVKRNLEVH